MSGCGLIVFGLGCIDVRLHGGKGFPPFGGFRHHHVVDLLKSGNVIIDYRKFLGTCGVFCGLEVFERFLHGCIRFFFCGGRIFRLQGNCTGGGTGFCRDRRYGGAIPATSAAERAMPTVARLALLARMSFISAPHFKVGDSAGSTTVSIPSDWRAADRACAPLRFFGNRTPLEMTSCLRFIWAHRTIMIRIECE